MIDIMFNVSSLGYEVFFNNYIKWDDNLVAINLNTGRPFKNNAVAVSCPNVVSSPRWKAGGQIEVWDQAIFGSGFQITTDFSHAITELFSLQLQMGYKSEGYSLGRTLDENPIGLIGLRYKVIK